MSWLLVKVSLGTIAVMPTLGGLRMTNCRHQEIYRLMKRLRMIMQPRTLTQILSTIGSVDVGLLVAEKNCSGMTY